MSSTTRSRTIINMFHTLFLAHLAIPLLSGAPAGVNLDTPLTAAIPADTIAAVHIPSPKRLVASRETNNWVAFAMDAEWNRFLGAFMRDLHDTIDPKEVPAWRDAVMGVAAETTGLIVFMAGDIEDGGDPPTIGLIARGGEATGNHMRRFMGTDATQRDIGDGRTALVSDTGRAELFYESAGLYLLMSTPKMEGSIAAAAECLRALDAGEPRGPFAIPALRSLRNDDAVIEIALGLDRVWSTMEASAGASDPLEKKAIEAISSVNWALMTGQLGTEENAEWDVYMPYGQDSLLGGMLGFFGEADRGLLQRVPGGSISATVANFDVKGFTDWTLATLKETSEEAHAQAQGALNGLRDLVGIDLLGDVFGNMDGSFLGFSSAPSANSESLMAMVGGMNRMTLVAGFADPEPMIDVVETLVDMSGMGGALSSESASLPDSDEELEIWRATDAEALGGVEAYVAVGGGELVLSTDGPSASTYVAGRTGGEPGPAFTATGGIQAAVDAASGSVVTIQPTAAAADALDGMAGIMDMLGPMLDVDEAEAIPVTSGDAMRGVADLFRQYFKGTTTTTMRAKDGLIRIRSLSR